MTATSKNQIFNSSKERCEKCNALGHLNLGSTLVGRNGIARKVAAGPFYDKQSAEEHAVQYQERYSIPVVVVKAKCDDAGNQLYYICEKEM